MYLKSKYIQLISTLLIFVTAVASGQNAAGGEIPQPDAFESYLQKYDAARGDEAAVYANKIAGMLAESGITDGLEVYDRNCKRDSVKADIYYLSGEYLHYFQQYDLSLKYALQAYALLGEGKNKCTLGDCANLIAIVYFRKSDYTNAINYAKKSYEIYREYGDKSRISSALNTIAGICLASKQFEQGEMYILSAITCSEEAKDSARVAIQCGMASELYHNMGQNDKALHYALRAYEIDSKLGNEVKIAIRLSQLATVYLSDGQLDEAKKVLKKALPTLEKFGNRQSYGICCNQMGSVLMQQNNPHEACEYFDRALEIFVNKGDLFNESKSRLGLYHALKQSNPVLAGEHLYRYSALKDTLYSQDMQKALNIQNARFKNEELMLQNENAKAEKKTILMLLFGVIAISILVILFMLYKRRMRMREARLQKDLQDTKDGFFANITHEFRTPLTVIQAAAASIKKGSAPDCDIYGDAENIRRHGTALLNLINQILDITKMTSAADIKPQWRRGDVVAFTEMVCECYRSYAESRGISIVYRSEEPSVEIDFIPDYLNKILQNLLSNAIKYSGPDTEVMITSNIENDSFKLFVCDSGRGISPDKLKNIFRPFYQAHDDNINTGTGIGLSLVKLAVEAMDGTVEVHSQEGIGTVFIITLPLHRQNSAALEIAGEEMNDFRTGHPESPESGLPDDAPGGEDAVRVLVIEDEPSIAKYIVRQLNKNYSYYYAKDGLDGLEKAEDIVPDIIISDVMMPGIDGYELCRKIRASELMSHIPVIMVTAKVSHEDRIRGLEAGADAYLEKPFKEDELNLRVEKLLEQRRMLREKFSAAVQEDTEEPVEMPGADREFLEKFTGLVKEQFQYHTTDLEKITGELCITKSQLNRKIKAITGMTSTTYIMNIRVGTAKSLLKSGKDITINDLSLMCGIEDVSYFITMFKKITGLTPKQYQTKNK